MGSKSITYNKKDDKRINKLVHKSKSKHCWDTLPVQVRVLFGG